MSYNYFVLPFRDTHGKYQKALDSFIDPFIKFLNINLKKYKIIIVEQAGNHNLFNLGRTINIGYDLMKNSMNDDDCFFFHPVDILPIDVDYKINKTTKFSSTRHSPNGEYYKAIGFINKDFKSINGFTNDCWGWGGEDDELKVRLKIQNIINETKINNYIELCDDGNGTENIPHYMPTFSKNINFSEQLKNHKNIFYSGLNNLNYKVLDVTTYNKIHKYIIE
jgi:hypothetical protein